MSKPVRSLCLLIPFAAMLSFAQAADVPMRKSGLWEIRTETRAGGQSMPGPMTMQVCIDQSKDDITAAPNDMQRMKQRCSKMDVKRSGNTVTMDSVCTHEGRTVTSHATITGNMTTDYRMESSARFSPPMHGMSAMESTMTGKWIGVCKPGQKHGLVTMSGMPGMPGGFKMDPEMMKRMQQMQQQYGR